MSARHMTTLWACFIALSLASNFNLIDSQLVAVYSVQRHGARNVLSKGILLTEGDLIGGPTLLPKGQFQTYKAGQAFRSRYLNVTTCNATCLHDNATGTKYGVVGDPSVGFGNFNVYVRSSSLDRTILSAQCFLNGIFPADNVPTNDSYLPTGAQVAPVYTLPDRDDILIRAYTKCPAYQRALEDWFRSPEFAAKEAQSAALRTWVQAAMPGTDTSLANWWNVYDSINVYRTYDVGPRVPYFNDTQFDDIQKLAYWLETSKMRSNLTRNLLGGVALADIISSLQAASNAVQAGKELYYKLLSLSGHYNTQLGLLAALELDLWPAAANLTWFRSIPKLAAVLVFELYAGAAPTAVQDAQSWPFYVRLVLQDGSNAPYQNVSLPCSSDAATAAAGAGACTLADFVSYASQRAMVTAGQWCTACGNDNVTACALAKAEAEAAEAEKKGSDEDCDGTQPWKIAVSVVVTFVGTVLLGAMAVWLVWRRRAGGSYGEGAAGVYGIAGPHTEMSDAKFCSVQSI